MKCLKLTEIRYRYVDHRSNDIEAASEEWFCPLYRALLAIL